MPRNFGGMTVDDMIYWLGFLAGVVIVGLSMMSFGWGRGGWVMAIACMVGGGLFGIVFEQVWKRMKNPPRPPMGGPRDEPPMRS